LPRFPCSFPTITWFRQPENRIPENFKEDREWDLQIIKAPKCPKTANLIRMIKTAPFNFKLRNYLRSHIRNQEGQTLGVFFLIGQLNTEDRRSNELQVEIDKFDDFIIGDYIDSYKNLTQKTFSGYKYVSENCHHDLKWALFIDDDTILNENELNQFFITTENRDRSNEEIQDPYCLAGLKWSKSGVVRPDNCFISQYKE